MSSQNQLKRKNERRLRRKRHVRRSVLGTAANPRLTVFRSHKNISCQLIDDLHGVTLASASTLDKDVRASLAVPEGPEAGRKAKAAAAVGKVLAERGKALGITRAAFDRNGYRFHGRIKALVEAARQGGLRI
jgi:large subunit ribosomal protein L18